MYTMNYLIYQLTVFYLSQFSIDSFSFLNHLITDLFLVFFLEFVKRRAHLLKILRGYFDGTRRIQY